ncbi:MAG TPA: hypothetical protein VJH03_12825 [Blastocatellia bacterium]|nr:hypothetical protein [Blastocatellia bacterium]
MNSKRINKPALIPRAGPAVSSHIHRKTPCAWLREQVSQRVDQGQTREAGRIALVGWSRFAK